MLPSRLFRNTGISTVLRSLIAPHARLPSTVAVQLRLRLGFYPSSNLTGALALRRAQFSTSRGRLEKTPPETANLNLSGPSSSKEDAKTTTSQPLPEKMLPRLQITFTCTVPDCGERSTHQFTKHSYEKGIVLVQCPSCKNRHLIADHLGWFKDSTGEGRLPTIEDIVKAKGEKVRRGLLYSDSGDIEYAE